MKYLVNGQPALGEGPGITFDLQHLMALNPPRAGSPGRVATMPDLLRRIIPRIRGPVNSCIIPDQIYIDLHWPWTGYMRVGSPVCNFAGGTKHVALCLWSLWQNQPVVLKGPVRRLCKFEGCANPHHYHFPCEPTPAPMTFTLEGDPGEIAAAEMVRKYQEVQRIIRGDPAE